MPRKTVLITGSSSGIGLHTAKKLVASNFFVFGSVRNQADAQRLKQELGENFEPLIFDITNQEQINLALQKVKKQTAPTGLDALINNAGIAFAAPALHIPIADFEQHLNVNTVGTLRVTQAFAPLLKANKAHKKKAGKLINIGSISGRVTRPFLGAYSASKFALEGLNDALRRELMPYKIRVVLIEPGVVRTQIWQKAKSKKPRFQDTDYAPIMRKLNHEINNIEKDAIPVTKVVNTLYKVLLSRKPKTRYLVSANPVFAWLAINILSDVYVDKMFYKRLKTLQKS